VGPLEFDVRQGRAEGPIRASISSLAPRSIAARSHWDSSATEPPCARVKSRDGLSSSVGVASQTEGLGRLGA
jgi:hypothetical protein